MQANTTHQGLETPSITARYIDHFRNDVINRQEYYVIPDMLAKNVGRSVGITCPDCDLKSALDHAARDK